MFTDYFLKFSSQAEADQVLFDKQVYADENDVVHTALVPRYAAVDVIGVIYGPTGKMLQTAEGEVPEMAPLEGWHANVRHTAEAPELEPFEVFPQTPARVWA